MRKSERKTKVVLWTKAVLDGQPARVSSVNGINRIIIGGFDIHVPGEFGGDPNKVLAAYKRQIEQIDAAFAKLPDDSEKPSCCDDNCGLIPISEDELDAEIREYEEHRGQVINIKTRQ